ncbi:MAG: hypothetical protein WA082_01190 [Candidatus Moraniibacteriota bacterium]
MSFENPTPTPEKEPRIPTLEELRYKVKGFIERTGQKNMKEERIFAEGKDVYFYEVSATDEQGDAYLYQYTRKGEFEHAKASATVVEVGYYIGRLEDGMCVGGSTASNYDDASGQWTDVL